MKIELPPVPDIKDGLFRSTLIHALSFYQWRKNNRHKVYYLILSRKSAFFRVILKNIPVFLFIIFAYIVFHGAIMPTLAVGAFVLCGFLCYLWYMWRRISVCSRLPAVRIDSVKKQAAFYRRGKYPFMLFDVKRIEDTSNQEKAGQKNESHLPSQYIEYQENQAHIKASLKNLNPWSFSLHSMNRDALDVEFREIREFEIFRSRTFLQNGREDYFYEGERMTELFALRMVCVNGQKFFLTAGLKSEKRKLVKLAELTGKKLIELSETHDMPIE